MFVPPLRFDMKASCEPSGEYSGRWSFDASGDEQVSVAATCRHRPDVTAGDEGDLAPIGRVGGLGEGAACDGRGRVLARGARDGDSGGRNESRGGGADEHHDEIN